MTETPDTLPAAPGDPTQLPPVVANIWNKFATRELAKGRRDIGHLVEVTLQFVMDQNTKNLQPMVNTLEQLRKWLLCIDKEIGNMTRALHENPRPTMEKPYQRQSIVLDKNAKNGPAVVISDTGQPTQARADLQSYVATMQKQRELVNQAMQEQTNALQARRDHLAQTLRQYSTELQRSANEMLANAPPLPEPKPRVTKEDMQALQALQALQQQQHAQKPNLANLLGRLGRALTRLNPVHLVRSWSRALVNGYQADPYQLPELAPAPVAAEVGKNVKKPPKVFTI